MIAGKRHAMGSPRLLAGLIVPLALVTLGVGAGPVPRSIRGSWVSGRCSAPTTRLDVGARDVRFGDSRGDWPVTYDPSDTDASGNAILHYAGEYVVSQFVYEKQVDLLVFYPKGRGMPGTEAVYRRCR